ncbi:polysaccharide deacetylase family protein [Streptomyces sp. NPDC052036]|uniref:polysaccharide deacetylase family protein n=1 Tax=Streptomyces sp. NPDC052036 TaxID=3155171 RepID=UPI003424274B
MINVDLISTGPIEVAMTVDDLVLWDGTPVPDGYTSRSISEGMAATFNDARITGVYAFAHTSPIQRDPQARATFEAWVDGGHHLGNHTHNHAPLNWVDADTYCREIDTAEKYIGDLIERAPQRYFRYAMDMPGPSEARREDHLRANGYTNAPITTWFGDFAFLVSYYRALTTGNREAAQMLRKSYVQAALFTSPTTPPPHAPCSAGTSRTSS